MSPVKRTPPKTEKSNCDPENAPQIPITPKSQSTSQTFFTPHAQFTQQNQFSPASTQLNNNGKRVAEESAERSINDVYDFLINRFNGLSNEINNMRADNNQFEKRLDGKIDSIKELMCATDQKLVTMDVKIDTNAKRIESNEKAVNYLMQEKLMNRMEISGYTINSGNDKISLKMKRLRF